MDVTENRRPEEVVCEYRRALAREVVETYHRPLPEGSRSTEEPKPKKRRSRKSRWLIGLLICLGIGVLITETVLIWRFITHQEEKGQSLEVQKENWLEQAVSIPAWPTGQGAKLDIVLEQEEALSIQEVYRKVSPSVVTILAYPANHSASVNMGTGVVFTADGYIITNYHIVAGTEDCQVLMDNGAAIAARYVAGSAENDLAILKIQTIGLQAAEFGDSDRLTVGDPVYAIGSPLGYELMGSYTAGIVSALNRDVQMDDGRVLTMIQTDAALNQGNSGGPLINQYGQVIGINVVKLVSELSHVEGLNFAIPSSDIERLANSLLRTGTLEPSPLLGITVLQQSVQLDEETWGLEVVDVIADSAGDRGGVQVGDYVVEAHGRTTRTSQDLLRARDQFFVGEEMPMKIWRDGKILEVSLPLLETVEE